jgi:putative transport protein
MWSWFVETLRHHPEMALFLTLAVGYWIGRIKLGTLPLGAVVGVLIAGVILGQFGIKVSSDLKTAFFLLFLFAIGYRTGPQFFGGLKASGLPQVALTMVLCGTALAAAFALAKAFGFDVGTAAGLMAGGLTESATLGTGTDAINRLSDNGDKARLLSNVTVAFAVTYFLGVITTLTFLSRVAPKILHVDLEAECKALEKKMGMMEPESEVSGSQAFVARAHRAESSAFIGKTVAEIERELREKGRRLFIPRLRHAGRLLETRPGTRVEPGDVVALTGRRAFVIAEGTSIGSEVEDREILEFPIETLDVVVTSKAIAGKTLGEIANAHAEDTARGVALKKIMRDRVELPWTADTRVARGDVVTLAGHVRDVERVAAAVGYVDRPSSAIDMVGVGLAVFVGGMIGIPALLVGKLEIGLSESVGVLFGGLVLGWLRSVDRRFARVPESALWLFDSLGLAAFVGVIALDAGPDFVEGLKRSGASLVVAGIVLAAMPLLVTLLVGRFIFKMHPGILLGVCCGACTSAPSLAAVQEVAKSKIPTLGYGVTYAFGNVLLALWGAVIVALMQP